MTEKKTSKLSKIVVWVVLIAVCLGGVRWCIQTSTEAEEREKARVAFWTPEEVARTWLSNVSFDEATLTAEMPNIPETPQILRAFLTAHPELEVTSSKGVAKERWVYFPRLPEYLSAITGYRWDRKSKYEGAVDSPILGYCDVVMRVRNEPTTLYTFRRK